MPITIRAALPADAPAVLSLWLEAETQATTTDDLDSVRRLIAHDPAALLVAESDGRLVGSVIAGWDGWRGSIYRLAVGPSERRRGLGRALVDEAALHLGSQGARRLQAVVVSDDDGAMGFWHRSGWEQQHDRTRFVRTQAPPG